MSAGVFITPVQRPTMQIKAMHVLRSELELAEQNETARIAAGRV
jgi:hypothetical protein